jgi:opacity protein-like surface antigen
MTRLAAATIITMALICSLGWAQDSTPKMQVFGGFSLVHLDNGKLEAAELNSGLRVLNSPFDVASNFMGWNAEAQYNANRWVGIVADFGGRYGTPITASRDNHPSGLPKASGYSFMIGPAISFRNKTKLTPYVHALFGYDRYTQDASTITGISRPVSADSTTFTDVVTALGGGFDYKVSKRFSLRLVQLDDFYTTHNFNKFYESAFPGATFYGLGTHQRNIRVSTGLIVSF